MWYTPVTMSAEAKVFSTDQIKYQRLFDVSPHGAPVRNEAGGFEKAKANAAALGVGLVADLAESHVIHAIEKLTYKPYIEKLKGKGASHDTLKKAEGVLGGFKFVEEWASDKAYSDLMNKWLQKATGVDDATYASEASAFISEWANGIVQIFYKNRLFGATEMKEIDGVDKIVPKSALKGFILFAHPMENFINPITVEASLRLAEQAPLVGGAVGWGKEKLTHALEHSSALKYTNTAAAKALNGYNIVRNVMA